MFWVFFFLNSVYIIKSIALLQFGRKTGTFCFPVDYFCQACPLFLKVGMEIKCFELRVSFIVHVCKISGFLK